MPLSRRSLITGGLALTALSGCGTSTRTGPVVTVAPVVPTNPLDQYNLGPHYDPALVPDVPIGPVLRGRFVSADRLDMSVGWTIMRPPGITGPLPVVVALHGHGGSAAQITDQWHGARFVAAAVEAGAPPFALAAVTGGNTFWHLRPSGEDAGAMVVDEFLPLLARHDLLSRPTDRIGLIGWSMGGYGVLRLAGLLGPRRVAAVCATSPGIYADPADALPDGFADAAEYLEYTVQGHQADLDGIPVRVDIGTLDPFYDAVRAYVAGFPPGSHVTSTVTPGIGHTTGYALQRLPTDLRWLADRLPAPSS